MMTLRRTWYLGVGVLDWLRHGGGFSTTVLLIVLNNDAFAVDHLFPGPGIVKCVLPLTNGLEVQGHEALIFGTFHSATIMA